MVIDTKVVHKSVSKATKVVHKSVRKVRKGNQDLSQTI